MYEVPARLREAIKGGTRKLQLFSLSPNVPNRRCELEACMDCMDDVAAIVAPFVEVHEFM